MNVQPYIGPWINHSRGQVSGATITLTSRHGAFLIAALSMFLVVVGSQFWKILSFVVHQLNATKRPTDALHCQHQAIFRNTGSSSGAAWELFKLPFSWLRASTRQLLSRPFLGILLRSWAWAFLALTNFCVWTAASLFSAEVTKAAGNDTLILPGNCGFTYDNSTGDGFGSKYVNDTLVAYPYARACYQKSSISAPCNTFVRKHIPWYTNQNASCPFQSGFCFYSDTAALELDTREINSHHDLGINAVPRNRVSYRRVARCAVIDPEVVRSLRVATLNNLTGDPIYQYYFGGNVAFNTRYTFEYDPYVRISRVGYLLESISSYAGDPDDSSWVPSEELQQSDSDLTLIWLFPNSLVAERPIDDPFFGFHATNSSRFYQPDNFANVMACTDKFQVCNPNTKGHTACTPLTAPFLLKDEIPKIKLNPTQLATATLILGISGAAGVSASVFGRGDAALLANEKVHLGFQSYLPNDQWMTEVKNWFAVSLTKLQYAVVEYATGPSSLSGDVILKSPTTPQGLNLCKSVKVPNPGGYQSFSVVGLSIILAFGSAIIFTSIVLEPLTCFIHKHWASEHDYRRLQWILDGKLQLQRMAFQYSGLGSWENEGGNVPVTADEAAIFCLPDGVCRRRPGFSERFDTKTPLSQISQEPSEQDGLIFTGPDARLRK